MKEVFTQEKNKIIFELQNLSDNKILMLEFSVEKSFNYLIIRNNYSKAGKNYTDLFTEISGKKILSSCILNNDRLIIFNLSDDYKIVFSFFNIKSNCYIFHDNIIISTFKESEKYKGLKFENAFPVLPVSGNLESNQITVNEYIKTFYKKYGNQIIEEVLSELQLDQNVTISENSVEKLRAKFEEIDLKLKNPDYLLYIGPSVTEISLIPLTKHKNSEILKFDDINQLLSEFIKINYKTRKLTDVKSSLLQNHRLKLSTISKKIRSLKTQLSNCEDAGRLKLSGDMILMNLDKITKGDTEMEIVSSEGEKLVIKLKPELTPAENANSYFEKYKRQKSSVKLIKEKIDKAEKEKQLCELEITKLEKEENIKKLLKEEKQTTKSIKDETSVFRKFILSDKYEVWIGKDSRTNDLLTSRYTLPHEIWFHVRGASGSHTVLKGGNKNEDTPKEFILKAASLAAYHSKARNAASVPVAYCEKKYVKKKKGFKQGSVVMEREKVVFVKPVRPDDN